MTDSYTRTNEPIDPIKQLMNVRNNILTSMIYMQEFHGVDPEIIWALGSAVESINQIQCWYMRNPNVIQNDL